MVSTTHELRDLYPISPHSFVSRVVAGAPHLSGVPSVPKETLQSTRRPADDPAKESADVFKPLKSAAGGLSVVLRHYDVRVPILPNRLYRSLLNQQTMASHKMIESLMLRVERLAESLRGPAPEGEAKEIGRRETLKK